MNRIVSLFATFICLLFSANAANAQPTLGVGCPGELIWTDGAVFAYDSIVCANYIGGGCSWSQTTGVLFYDQMVTAGCGTSPNCADCATSVRPIGHGGGGPSVINTNGTLATKINSARIKHDADVPRFGEFVGQGTQEDDESNKVWFKFVTATVIKKGTTPEVLTEFELAFVVNPGSTPKKFDMTDTPYTPTKLFDGEANRVITFTANGEGTPLTVKVVDNNGGTSTTTFYPVVNQP